MIDAISYADWNSTDSKRWCEMAIVGSDWKMTAEGRFL
jgi:hypothetical protein